MAKQTKGTQHTEKPAKIANTKARKARNVAAQKAREDQNRYDLEHAYGITKLGTYERVHILPRVWRLSKNPSEAKLGKGYYETPTVTRTHPVRPSGALRRARRANAAITPVTE